MEENDEIAAAYRVLRDWYSPREIFEEMKSKGYEVMPNNGTLVFRVPIHKQPENWKWKTWGPYEKGCIVCEHVDDLFFEFVRFETLYFRENREEYKYQNIRHQIYYKACDLASDIFKGESMQEIVTEAEYQMIREIRKLGYIFRFHGNMGETNTYSIEGKSDGYESSSVEDLLTAAKTGKIVAGVRHSTITRMGSVRSKKGMGFSEAFAFLSR